MGIIKLIPACKDYIWGGNKLKRYYNKTSELNRIAETWELSTHIDGPSRYIDTNGNVNLLNDYINQDFKRLLGSNCQDDNIPILIKLIDANDNLSIQVHPDNDFARKYENQNGKTEAWIILEADPYSYIYCGFNRKITIDEYKERIADNTLTDVLNKVYVHKGDVIYIPAGTIHAICKGIVIAEVQQSSNVTYRVFDYGRLDKDGNPRTLHIDKAIAVTKLEKYSNEQDFSNHLVKCDYFTCDFINAPYEGRTDGKSFVSLLVINGEGLIKTNNEEIDCKKGDCIFITADTGIFSINGNLSLIMTTV